MLQGNRSVYEAYQADGSAAATSKYAHLYTWYSCEPNTYPRSCSTNVLASGANGCGYCRVADLCKRRIMLTGTAPQCQLSPSMLLKDPALTIACLLCQRACILQGGRPVQTPHHADGHAAAERLARVTELVGIPATKRVQQ